MKYFVKLSWQKSTKQPTGARIHFWQQIAWPASFLHTGVTSLILLISVNLFEIFQWKLLFKLKKILYKGKVIVPEYIQWIYGKSSFFHVSRIVWQVFKLFLWELVWLKCFYPLSFVSSCLHLLSINNRWTQQPKVLDSSMNCR